MHKPATILSIANELNITAATVSRALQDHPGYQPFYQTIGT